MQAGQGDLAGLRTEGGWIRGSLHPVPIMPVHHDVDDKPRAELTSCEDVVSVGAGGAIGCRAG